jgi:hypothetical protein
MHVPPRSDAILRTMPLGLTVRLRAIAIATGGLVIGAGAGLACNVDTEPGGLSPVSHCSNDGGNALCVANYGSRPYCSLCADENDNQGCVASPPVGACAPGGGFPIPSDGSGDDGVDDGMQTSTTEALVDTTSGSSSDSGVDDTSTGDAPCMRDGLDPDCEARDAATPYCQEGVCVGCVDAGGDDFCAVGVAPETPACDAESGACVACDAALRSVCTGATPVCGSAGACEACTEHGQCPDTACHINPTDPLAGSCFAPDEVRWVNNTAICPGMGTEAQPSCSLVASLGGIPDGANRVIKVVASGVPITQRPETTGPYTVAILGVNGVPVLNGNPASAGGALVNGGGALTYIQNLRLVDNPLSHGLTCASGQVWIDDTEIAGNAGWGIFDTAPCNLTVRRGTLHHNETGGIRLFGGTLDLVNATIAVNGDGSSGPGIDLQFASINALYSTIVGNDGATSDSITCNMAEGVLRNSIVQGVSNFSISLDCFGFMFTRNALDNSNFAQGTNVLVPVYNSIQFVDPANGDFRLEAPPLSPFGDVAQWEEGDPVLDADGTPRPTDGSLGYAGIDEPG